MPITLGGLSFDPARTSVREVLEEVGGRDRRRIHLDALLTGFDSTGAIEAHLDAVLAAVPADSYGSALSLRPGRRVWVRRTGFSRQLAPDEGAGAFNLELAAREPFEEAETATELAWAITEAPAELAAPNPGTLHALPVVTLAAEVDLEAPGISGGGRTLVYDGVVPAGGTLTVDAAAGQAWLDAPGFSEAADVTPYTSGQFPRVPPGGGGLTYDGAPGTHEAAGTVWYRARWW